MRAGGPGLELLGVTALAGRRADVVGGGGEQVAPGPPALDQLGARGVAHRGDLRVGDLRMEACVVEAEGVLELLK